jgi:hypothetical protein
MKIKILASMLAGALAMLPVTANAGWGGGGVGPYGDPITIYGWQNHTYEVMTQESAAGVDTDTTQIRGNAGNIGFLGFVDTGIEGLKVTWRCEQFTYLNDFGGQTGWCNRNSKVGISGSFGEIMFANWLLPYNEMVAGWVDPWYDAGSASHTNIMGSVGEGTIFYNLGGFGSGFTSYSDYGGIFNQGFNRRQEEILQYMGSTGKVSYRFAMTADNKTDAANGRAGRGSNLDPVIYSMGIAYADGPFWGALTYQKHEEWAAATLAGNTMSDSEAESYRIAARYIADLGNGASLTLSAMFENVEYELNDTTTPGAAMTAFGFGTRYIGGDANGDVSFDRDAFLVSGKYAPGGNFDFRFMYAEADDLDVSATGTLTTDSSADSGADTTLFGVFYALGDSTELNVSYIEVSNDSNANYGTGISAVSAGVGGDVEIIQFGILTMF